MPDRKKSPIKTGKVRLENKDHPLKRNEKEEGVSQGMIILRYRPSTRQKDWNFLWSSWLA
jgi:hypothetical protein